MMSFGVVLVLGEEEVLQFGLQRVFFLREGDVFFERHGLQFIVRLCLSIYLG